MARHIVCLSFDFDTVSGWIASGQTTPTPVSRGEFGVIGAARIRALLEKHGVRATWFTPGVTIETYPDACAEVALAGHEITHHGYQHVAPSRLSREQEEEELVRANEAIRKLSGQLARGYRSPAWDLSPHTVELLVEHGFVYDSSLMGDDHRPYRARSGDRIALDQPVVFGAETRLIELPISWTLDDYPHFELARGQGLRAAGDVFQNWLDDFVYMARTTDWGVLTYTFHPFVIGRGHRMLVLERLIADLQERGAVFLTMEEAAAEFAQREGADA